MLMFEGSTGSNHWHWADRSWRHCEGLNFELLLAIISVYSHCCIRVTRTTTLMCWRCAELLPLTLLLPSLHRNVTRLTGGVFASRETESVWIKDCGATKRREELQSTSFLCLPAIFTSFECRPSQLVLRSRSFISPSSTLNPAQLPLPHFLTSSTLLRRLLSTTAHNRRKLTSPNFG